MRGQRYMIWGGAVSVAALVLGWWVFLRPPASTGAPVTQPESLHRSAARSSADATQRAQIVSAPSVELKPTRREPSSPVSAARVSAEHQEEGGGFELEIARELLEPRTREMLARAPRRYQDENMRDLARALEAVEDIRETPEYDLDKEQWDADYARLQNAYFQGVRQLRGVQRPSDAAQRRLNDYAERSRGLPLAERQRLKAELLYER